MTVGLLYATRQEAEPLLSLAEATPLAGPLPMFRVPETIHPACVVAVGTDTTAAGSPGWPLPQESPVRLNAAQ